MDAAGGGDFTGIQEAIDAVKPHDILEVAPGVYPEASTADLDFATTNVILAFDKGLTLRGTGPEEVVIESAIDTLTPTNGSYGLVFDDAATRVVIEGLTVDHGIRGAASSYAWYAGMSSEPEAVGSLDMSHVVFRMDATNYGKILLRANSCLLYTSDAADE